MKDKYGYEIVDKGNAVRTSSENTSGTWRDDKYEDCLHDIIDLIKTKYYPDDLNMQASMILSLPSLFATTIIQDQVERHENGESPHYVKTGRAISELHDSIAEALLPSLELQVISLAEYLEQCPLLIRDEKMEELR